MKKFALILSLTAMTCIGLEWRLEAQNTTKALMTQKLKSAQAILEGVALADFKKINKNAGDLIQLTRHEEWLVIKKPRYEMFSNEFRRAAENLIQKSTDKNIDGAALAYMELTLTCVRCHQYVRDLQDVSVRSNRP